ncbi:MAG TPA: hypothetical protein VFP56_05165 [Candidatus Limnocylindrales bacterium]|nr:hypothetical protein [Candidatus Limnocylindrales bacterium]HEX5040295.1 hypothetical protein [Candidatus Limnocylindria bacterium]
MSDEVRVGAQLRSASGRRIGRVDAVFADYLLVRTAGLLPVDLYVPRDAVAAADGRLGVSVSREEAYARWHRPLKKAPHAD